MKKKIFKRALLYFVLLNLSHFAFSQNTDDVKAVGHFGGAVSVTNNGISFIPNLTLGKPAAIFDLSMGREKLSFEPQFRFALEGKPWSFVFWWRYKLLKTEKIQINIGAHPAISFKTMSSTINGEIKETLVAHRYLAGELSPNISLAKNISAGIYYFYAYGVEKEITKNTQLLALRSNFSNIGFSNQLFLRFAPQIYFLKMDDIDGYYATLSLALVKKDFPISVSAIINKTIQTDIPGKNLLWNASLIYTFNKEYINK